MTKPRSNGISIDARGTDEVVNLDDIVLLPKLAKKSKGEQTARIGNQEILATTVRQKNEISRQLVFVSNFFLLDPLPAVDCV